MARPLAEGDTAQALALLAERPLENVFLEHVIRAGVLGRMPGFFGCDQAGLLVGILMVAPGGGTSLEVRDSAAYKPLAEIARLRGQRMCQR